MKKTSAILLSLCASFLFAGEPELKNTEKITSVQIAKFIMTNDGYLDKNLHNLFWSNINKYRSSLNDDKMKLLLLDMPHIQLLIWKSIRKSIVTRKRYYAPGLKEELQKLYSSMPNAITITEQMISDAATNTPHRFGKNEKIPFTLAMADEFIENWNNASERGEALYNESFSFTPSPRILTSNMRLDWEFSPKKQKVDMRYGENTYKGIGFSLRVSKDEYAFVSEIEKEVKPLNKEALSSCVQGFFNTMGNKNKLDIKNGKNTSFSFSDFTVKGTTDHIWSAVGCEMRNNKVYAMVANSTEKKKTAKLFVRLAGNLHLKKGDTNGTDKR